MCIICIKKKGVKFPSIKQVETMCTNNPHGFSMVVQTDGFKPAICKTLNEYKFIKLYKKVIEKYDYRKTSMFIHARIKTHGSEKIENCHGWKSDGLVFAHNGILSISNREDLTDSETFFRDIFIPAFRVGGWEMGERTINAIIGTSKFVFMDNEGNIKHYGRYQEDDGLLFSNDSYIPYRQRYTIPTYQRGKWYNDWGYGYNYLDDDAEEWNKALKESEKIPF